MSEADDLAFLDIAGLAGRIGRRDISPVEVTAACLDRIDRLDGVLNAYIAVHPEQALDAARAAETEIAAGNYRGPLHGVPLAIKDLYQVDGMARTCGSRIAVADAPGEATSVTRLRNAGAIVLGVLNLHEFAFGATGINPNFGSARNPWDTDRVCGGSSSGSACAVAAALAAGALGTDTGGSIRIPAALCGVVGLKQTYGLASRHGIFPLADSFDHGGPLARTVADAALLLQAIAGEDANDPTTRGARSADFTARLGEDVRGVRLGVPARFFFDDLHPGVESAVRAAIDLLAELGAEVREIDVPFAAEAVEAWDTIALAEAYTLHEDRLAQHGEIMSPDSRARMLRGKDIPTTRFVRARVTQERIKREMAALLEEVDVLVMPSTPIPAVPLDSGTIEVAGAPVEGARVLGRLTRLAAFTGQPAISVPCGFTGEGLPVGLQLLGRWFGEADLLRVAHAYESAAPWRERRPPVTAQNP